MNVFCIKTSKAVRLDNISTSVTQHSTLTSPQVILKHGGRRKFVSIPQCLQHFHTKPPQIITGLTPVSLQWLRPRLSGPLQPEPRLVRGEQVPAEVLEDQTDAHQGHWEERGRACGGVRRRSGCQAGGQGDCGNVGARADTFSLRSTLQ